MEKDKRMTEKERKHEPFCFEGHANVNKGCDCPCHAIAKVSARERAERILEPQKPSGDYSRELGLCTCPVNRWRREVVRVTSEIEQAEREARNASSCSHCSGSLQSFQLKWHRGCLCECHVGTYEDAYKEGYKAGAEAFREMAAKVADALHAKEQEHVFNDKGHMKSNALGAADASDAIAIEIRALPLPSDTTAGKE